MKNPEQSLGKKLTQVLGLVVVFAVLCGAIFLARRNYRHGRGDREGAFRLALVIFVLQMLLWLCSGHFVANYEMFGLFIVAISTGLFGSAVTWMLYLALEPWVRRRWPQALISWSRLLSGQFRDPVVGRDVLFGTMLGVLWIVIFQINSLVLLHMGAVPGIGQTDYIAGGRAAVAAWLTQIPNSIQLTLVFFFLLLGLKVLLRKDWLAAIAFIAIFALPRGLSSSHMAVDLPTWIVVYFVAVLIVFRFGLVPLACAAFTVDVLVNLPVTSDLSAWYIPSTVLALLSVVALAGWGFYHSLGGEPLWRPEIEQDL